jgi:hypothetical protein
MVRMTSVRIVLFAAFVAAVTPCLGQTPPDPAEATIVAEMRALDADLTLNARGKVEELFWGPELEHRFTERQLDAVANLTDLKVLGLTNSSVTDAGLKQLLRLKRLEELYLQCEFVPNQAALITDAALQHLKQLSRLTHLYLEDADITDRGLAVLSEMTQLKQLSLFGTEITDAGLPLLRKLTNLTYLDVAECQWETKRNGISAAAAHALMRQMPKCKIDY